MLRITNYHLNSKIEERAKILISYIESTLRVDVKKVRMKFMEDIAGEVYLLGVEDTIYSMPKGQEEGQKWKGPDVLPVCYGEFCDYEF